MISFGRKSLENAVREYVEHYHAERNHQGLGNQLIEPGNEIWHIDTSVVRFLEGSKASLHAVIDNYSRRALS
jgi:hypothetical protein